MMAQQTSEFAFGRDQMMSCVLAMLLSGAVSAMDQFAVADSLT